MRDHFGSTTARALVASCLLVGCKDSSIDVPGGPNGGLTCANFVTKTSAPALWSKHAPTGSAPSQRWLHTQVYNATTDRMIVFGGLGTSAPTNDVWVLSNATGVDGTPAWTALATTGSAPAPRDEPAAVYDEANNILIIHGGAGADDKFVDDTWILTNADGTGGPAQWTKLATTGAPSVRYAPSAVYDPASNTMALFGGIACNTSSCTQYDETWLLSNANGKGTSATWKKLAVGGTLPKGRSHHSAVLDPKTGAMIVFGGETSTALTLDSKDRISDTWVLTDAFAAAGTPAWKRLAPTSPPSGRGWHGAVYDPSSNRMTIFGGAATDNYVHHEVFVLTNANGSGGVPAWGLLNVGTPTPTGRDTSAIYSPAKNRLVIFAGNIGDKKLTDEAWVLRNANGVPSSKPAKVTVSVAVKTMCVGYKTQLAATAVDAEGKTVEGGVVEWKWSDSSICEVDLDGWVEGFNDGTCEITASIDGVISDPVDLTVATPKTMGGGGDETWVVLRPDGAPSTITISGGNVAQTTGKAWTILNNTGECSFPLKMQGTVLSGRWQVTAEGSGCAGYHTKCTLTGSTDGTSASGPVTCDNDTPGGSIRDTGTWTAKKQ